MSHVKHQAIYCFYLTDEVILLLTANMNYSARPGLIANRKIFIKNRFIIWVWADCTF